jgi:hypothetical protein
MKSEIVSLFLYLCFSCHLLLSTITRSTGTVSSNGRSNTLCAPEYMSIQFPHCHHINRMLCSTRANSTANIRTMGSSQGGNFTSSSSCHVIDVQYCSHCFVMT